MLNGTKKNYWGIIGVDLDVTDQLLITYWRENGSTVGE